MGITDFKNKFSGIGLATTIILPVIGYQVHEEITELPNILWIVSEDNSAWFTGCYGNFFATTPNLDRFASEGFLYTHAYANCPVSAPARNTILTGVYAASNGHENMRSYYPKSDKVELPPYHPDTPEMRHGWAQYYDRVEDMDNQVGELLKELEESGEAENTIVFYYGDHGGVLARSKRFVYETGTLNSGISGTICLSALQCNM